MSNAPILARALALALATFTTSAAAEPPADKTCPTDMRGVVRPVSHPGDAWRGALDVLLFVPRTAVEVVVLTSTATASFIENQNIVPRTRALLGSEDGKIRVAPTISLASRLRPDVGARLTAQAGIFGSMLRTSIVGRDHFLTESRLIFGFGGQGQGQLILDGFQARNGELAFGGVGPDPARDPRNVFLPGRAGFAGAYLEKRERFIASVAYRIARNLELLLSTSLQRREIEDPRESAETLAQTFAPGTLHGAYDSSNRAYTEAAVRYDTRVVRGPPAEGILLEGYVGASGDVRAKYASALHAGGRAALFIPIVRKTSILSPRVALDAVDPEDLARFPFREYAYPSGFRGPEPRVDLVAAIASLDYRWQLVSYIAARVFVDVSTVAPKVSALRPDHLRWAVGAAIDFHSSTTQIARVGIAYSASAVQLVLVYGLSDPSFGDRQHR